MTRRVFDLRACEFHPPRSIGAFVSAWAIAFAIGIVWTGATAAPMQDPIPLTSGVSAAAARRLDPRLLMALSMPREESALAALSKSVPMTGDSVDDITFPVILQSTLTDAELADLGAKPDSRIGDIVTARVSQRDLGRLAEHPGVRAVEASYRLEPALDISVPEVKANLVNNPSTGGYSGRGVLYGLLDDGLDLTHQDFRNAAGQSRVQAVWDQWVESGGSPPKGFDYGHEYTKQMIDDGQTTQFINDGGHGSHVAGISVGDGSHGNTGYRGIAWEADIAVVRNGTCDLFCYGGGNPFHGDHTTKGAIDGVVYLKRKAMELGKPLVINQSQGVTMGPHDGTTLFEAAYDSLIRSKNIIIAVAAGNDQDAGWHGRQNVPSGGSATFTMTHDTSPQAGQPLQFILFEVWYDSGKQFSYVLRNPSGEPLEIPATTGDAFQAMSSHNDVIVYYSAATYAVNQQGYLLVYMENQQAGVEGGQWQLQVSSQGGSSGVVDFYGERNQYNFQVSNPNLTSIVAMPGSADEVITVASYNTRFEWPNAGGIVTSDDGPNAIGQITTFSSQGPRRDGAQKPDLAAPGKWIVSSLATGHQTQAALITPDGKHYASLGTSMACPHVAGAIALMLEKDPSLTHTEVKQILQQTARHDGFTGSGWTQAFGHGKLDVQAAVNAVQGGGGGSCSTTSGDSNLNQTLNVLDLVATVNHILGSVPLSSEAIACADVNQDQQVTVADLLGAVGLILNAGRPASPATETSPIAWGETVDDRSYRLTLDAPDLGGIQLAFIPPRGFEVFGEPVLHGAGGEASVAWSEALGQYSLVAYDPSARPLAKGEGPLTLEIPLLETWDGDQEPDDFAVTRLLLADTRGGTMTLASAPSLDPAPDLGSPGGVRGLLERTSPNPMIRTTEISYRIDVSGPVRIEIFDPSGRKIRSLWDGHQMAGGHILSWDGRDQGGAAVSDGMYFVRIQAGGSTDTEKILVVR